MKVKFHYPMLGTGRSKQGRVDKMGVVIGEWVADIPEATSEEAPVAIIVCPDGKTSFDIRWYGGALYRAFPAGRDTERENDTIILSGLTSRLERFLGNRMQNDIFAGTSRQSYYPEGISASTVVSDLQQGKCGIGYWKRPDGQFSFDDDGVVEAETWRAMAEDAADCLISIGGAIWEKCEEPIYKIATRASPGVDVLGGRVIAASPRNPILGETDPDDRLFNALEYELALHAKETAKDYQKDNCKEQSDYIEVLIPQAIQYQSAEGEMLRLARFLIEDVEREIAEATKTRATKWSDRFSISLINAWNEVRNAEIGFDLPGGHDKLEETVIALLSQISPLNERKTGCLRDEDAQAMISRWQDREICLEGVAYGQAMN
jgi:hypothetical protein